MKDSSPSLVDVILTNRPMNFIKRNQRDTGLSDWHNITFTVLKKLYFLSKLINDLQGFYGA